MGRNTPQNHYRDIFRTCSPEFGMPKNRSFGPATDCELIDAVQIGIKKSDLRDDFHRARPGK